MELLLWAVVLILGAKIWSISRRCDALEHNWVHACAGVSEPEPERCVAPSPAPRVAVVEKPASTWPAFTEPVAERQIVPPPPLPVETVAPPPLPPEPMPEPRPEPALPPAEPADRTSSSWEATLGGNWLSKLGAALLAIGLALFLSYSLNRLSPGGRVATGVALSVAMLTGGLLAERKEGYKNLGRGLVGGGWAALYFTTYAAHALAAAHVIDSSILATALLLTVAAGMVTHALLYRSRAAILFALLLAFGTLALSTATSFALIALLPLTAVLAYIAARFEWVELGLAGIPVTYVLYLYQASQTHTGRLALGQTILFLFWMLYEGLDIWHEREDKPNEIREALFPIHTAAFLLASGLQWLNRAPQDVWQFAWIAGAAYAVNAFVRAMITGKYDAPLTMASGLTAVGSALHLQGVSRAAALFTEGQILFALGMYLEREYVHTLAAVMSGIGAVATLFELTIKPSQAYPWRPATPLALFGAIAFYANRASRSAASYYGHAGTLLFLAVLGWELPVAQVGIAWLLVSVAAYEIWTRSKEEDFEFQAHWAGVLALAAFAAVNLCGVGLSSGRAPQAQQIIGAALLAGMSFRIWLSKADPIVRDGLAWAASITLAVWMWNVLPSSAVVLGWAALSLALIELSEVADMPALRLQGHLMSKFVFARLFISNFDLTQTAFGISLRTLTVTPVIALHYYLHHRLYKEPRVRRAYLYSAGILLAALIRFEAGRVMAVVGWAALLAVFAYLGRRYDNRDLRWQALALAVLSFVRCWASNFNDPESMGGMPTRVLTGAAVIAALYLAQAFSRGRAKAALSLMGGTLLAVLLFYEVSGRVLTMAWGLEGAMLLGVGFPLHDRTFRLSGLGLMALCTGKLFLFDLSNLDTPYRIASFLVLGVLLIAASWAYSRFREQFIGFGEDAR